MAQDTVDVLNRRDGSRPVHPTVHLPLQGSAGWPKRKTELERKGTELGLDSDIITQLGRSYGTEAETVMNLIAEDPSLANRLVDDLPYIRAQVVYACHYEMAMTPADVLARRTAIRLQDRRRGLGVVDEVAALMAQELDWKPDQLQAMVDAYRTSVEQQMAAEVGA
jgi:glycerol-3-phosphate dehydrogenase